MSPAGKPGGWPLGWLAGLGAFVCVAIGAGRASFTHGKGQLRAAAAQHLGAIADLKARQLAKWREDRLENGAFIANTRLLTSAFERLLADPESIPLRSAVLNWMAAQTAEGGFCRIVLADAQTRTVVSFPDAYSLGPAGSNQVWEAWQAGRPVLSDLHPREGVHETHIDLTAPLFAPGATPAARSAPAGAVLLMLDPRQRLFPIVQEWPASSPSADCLLYRKEGRALTALTDPRRGPPGAREAPIEWTPAFDVEPGAGGPAWELTDPRGVAILAAARQVPGMPWYVLAQMDRAEVYAPARRLAGWIAAVVAASCAAGGLVLWGAWQRAQTARARRELALTERLALLTRQANDAILLLNAQWRVVEANDRAVEFYGYTRQELLQLSLRDLRVPRKNERPEDTTSGYDSETGALIETLHRRKDGGFLAVEVSARSLLVEGRLHYQAMVRDITERKRQNHEIHRLNRLYAVLSQTSHAIVEAANAAALFQALCDVAVRSGQFKLAWIAWLKPGGRTLRPAAQAGDGAGYVEKLEISLDDPAQSQGLAGSALREGRPAVCNDFLNDSRMAPWRALTTAKGFRSAAAVPIPRGGASGGALMIYSDEPDIFNARELQLLEEVAANVSAALDRLDSAERHAQAETRRHEAERRLATLMASLPGLAYRCSNDPAWTMEFVSEGSRDLTGYAPEELVASRHTAYGALIHPDDAPAVWTGVQEALARRAPYTLTYRIAHKDGSQKWVMERGQGVFTPQGALAALEGFILDITQRKLAEERTRAALDEKVILLREIHHRVKNNLAIVIALAGLQARQSDDPRVREVIQTLDERIRAIALVHEHLHQSADLGRIDAGAYLNRLASHLVQVLGATGVRFTARLAPAWLGIDSAIPLGLIVTELVTNSVKHAFAPGPAPDPELQLSFGPDGPGYVLEIRDNGPGLPAGLDWRATRSLGLRLVNRLALQLDARLTALPGPGAAFRLEFVERTKGAPHACTQNTDR